MTTKSIAFTPIRLGAVTVPNRIVRAAHGTGFSGNEFTDDLIAYHAARARGGCGLSILEGASVHWSSALAQSIASNDIVPGFARLMDAVRPYGMKVFQQLWHGGNLYPSYRGTPWAVSTVPGVTGIVGHPMTTAEVEELRDAFVAAALRCQAGGLDGVEVHAAHGYLIQQFLSPITNTRTDCYGGSTENRQRFLIEVLQAIRAAVREDFAVGIRIGFSDSPGGLSLDDIRPLTRKLDSAGLIDFLDASLGDYTRMATFYGAMDVPSGYEIPAISPLTEGISVPRIVTGRFRTIDEAEQVLRDGVADLVSMVRAQIADPELVNKSQEGKAEDVRPCIACNQGCVGGYIRDHRMGCLVNPAVGYEQTMGEELIIPAAEPKTVMVVGGGPAGLEAARVSALAGHRVILAEASANLGGAVEVARRAPRYHTLGDIVDWLERQVYAAGVDVRLGTYLEADDVRTEEPDVVIVATGSLPRLDGFQPGYPGQVIQGVDQAHVVSAVDLLTRPWTGDVRNAVIVDSVGHFEALSACEFLLTKGVAVTFVTHHAVMSPYVETTLRMVPTLERFHRLGMFEVLTRHLTLSIGQDACTVRPAQGGPDMARTVLADLVVLVSPNEPMRELCDGLQGDAVPVVVIGDAASPRDMQSAIAEGHRAARAL